MAAPSCRILIANRAPHGLVFHLQLVSGSGKLPPKQLTSRTDGKAWTFIKLGLIFAGLSVLTVLFNPIVRLLKIPLCGEKKDNLHDRDFRREWRITRP